MTASSAIADVWPTEDRMREDIGLELAGYAQMKRAGRPMTVIPGFEDVRVDGVKVGRWLTARDVGREGPEIVGASFYTRHECLSLFILAADKAAFERDRKARRGPKLFRLSPEKEIEDAIASSLRDRGHDVDQQVLIPGGIADIVDRTGRLLIECKADAGSSSILQALDQLDRYAPYFDGFEIALGLPTAPVSRSISRSLRRMGVSVITPASVRSEG